MTGASRCDEAPDRRAHAVLGQPAHFEQARLELFQLFLKVGNDAVGHDFRSYQLSAISYQHQLRSVRCELAQS